MNLVYVLGGIIISLLGALFFQKSKKDSAEALLTNLDTKNKLNELDKTISQNDGQLASEELKRQQLEQELEKKKNETPSIDDLNKFLNKPGNKPS